MSLRFLQPKIAEKTIDLIDNIFNTIIVTSVNF